MPASLKTSKGQTTIPKEIRKHLHREPGDRMMAMKCLIVGGGGFLVSHTCDVLLAAGHRVRVFEKQYVSKQNIQHVMGAVEWIEGDFTNESRLKEIVQGMDCIVHAIGTTLTEDSNENPVYDISSNVISKLHLLDTAKKAG